MKRLTRSLVVLSLFAPSLGFSANCNYLWQKFDSSPYVANLFIDSNNTYWKLKFRVANHGTTGFKITGEFPYGRYLSFNVYDTHTFNTVSTISDRSIQPDEGNVNPFWNGIDRNAPNRKYTLYLVPQGEGKRTSEANVIELPAPYPKDKVLYVEVWYRIYFPDRGSNSNGNVSLPTLTSFNTETLEDAKCPMGGPVPTPNQLSFANLPPNPYQQKVYFYRSGGQAIYSEPDNHYLVSRLTHRKSEVYVFRFRAPEFANTYQGMTTFNGNTDLRYWSVCVAGLNGVTGECLADAKTKIASDGFVNVVVGEESLRQSVKKLGFNFISRGNFFIPIVLYRNLLSSETFEGNALHVPQWHPNGALSGPAALPYAAHRFIGDYAPKGHYCSIRKFFENYCDVPISR